jgi:subtilisin family serine protease
MTMNDGLKKLQKMFAAVALGVLAAVPVAAQQAGGPVNVSRLKLSTPAGIDKVDASLGNASGEVEVVVRLAGEPLAIANGPNSRRVGGVLTRTQQTEHSARLRMAQTQTMARIAALGGTELGRVRVAYNALIVRVDAAALASIAQLPEVQTVKPVGRYDLDLSETVPYIGATAVQATGKDGTGVTVAVLDSGIDYTHAAFGGPGTLGGYQAARGASAADPLSTTLDGLFPTPKVVGGYDFVGGAWPNAARSEDPDPIDDQGHGTHVADIIAGLGGVAPGASLMAVKVCSAVATSCNGEALLLGMDFALDPNGDGAMDDAVDIVNMSLGSSYGQIEDDLSFAAANAVAAGVVVVASAGNSADRPYILGSPSSTPAVISVAQTQVPGGKLFPVVINAPAAIAGTYPNTATFDWAPLGTISGDVVFVGVGCNANPYLADPAGKVALIDRGTCNISEKVRRASDAGATGILIGLVAAGDAVTFSNGGQCPVPADGTCKPSLVITQADANRIKTNIAAPVNVTATTSVFVPLARSMVGSSSRGPSVSFDALKPDIGAPGASVSALVGTGTGTEAFGGTSGAAPMVSGAAALLVQAFPARSPLEIKAALMNNAETNILTNPATLPGVLAPITRIGGGEVRVDRAVAAKFAAWTVDSPSAGLSFGYQAASGNLTLNKTVMLRNYTTKLLKLPVSAGFRYADDAASGAVKLSVPKTVTLPPRGSVKFNVQMKIDASRLPVWTLDGGAQGGNGPLLQTVEFDGYLTVGAGADTVRLPWHVLPHKAAQVSARPGTVKLVGGKGSTVLQNRGVLPGQVDVFALTGTSPRIGDALLPGPGDNYAMIDLKSVGARLVDIGGGEYGVQFGINTYGERSHPSYPAGFEVDIDTDGDSIPDFAVYSDELGSTFAATGQTAVYVVDLSNGTGGAYFYADADLNSGNMILTAPLSVLGLTPSSQFSFYVLGYDNYFTGDVTDFIDTMTVTLDTPRFAGGGLPATGVRPGGQAPLAIQAIAGGDVASPSQTGLLLLYRDAKPKAEADTITVIP